ncbi:conserved protein of unknown function [Tenacibaculum sp. 190524A02b]|uniref:hypothetical protein n=1 Tax=Tenacibaculum vairaonense TaxID=3137860 RepID=UPI0032B24382
MYSESSIELLYNRIKWHAPFDKELANVLEEDLKAKPLSKCYQHAHKLVTISNIHAIQPEENISKEKFNQYLRQLVSSCVYKILEDVFDSEVDSKENYDLLVSNNPSLFDESLKHYMTIQVIQLMITTNRRNSEERLLKSSYPKLKVELDGTKNENGKVLSVGVNYLYSKSIKNIKNKLFPSKPLTVEFVNKW